MSWITRESFPAGRAAQGLLLISPDGEVVAPLDATSMAAAQELAADTLKAAGLGTSDRVVVALNNDGEGTGTLLAQAAASVAAAAGSVGARGRLRLHTALERVRATTLVTTPSGAMDFLARLHLEFLLDPLDLELKHIFLVGEVASPGALSQLAGEFEASVVELYADPFYGVPIATRTAAAKVLTPVRDGLLGLAPLDKDALLEAPYSEGLAELIVMLPWSSPLRTGQVVRTVADGIPAPAHTVGEHVLIRGRWISIPKVAAALTRIDGLSRWDLRISHKGTLDSAVLHVSFKRDTLVRNPMWKGRIQQALAALTPVSIDVEVHPEVVEVSTPGTVTDLRDQHLGRNRL
ncbi:MAG TPA: hypothetical protein VNW94_15295 [Streptosporangiaceae bacterium]|nr:hypothetical protein [Streptosporangiaceae bacterium]